MAKTKLSSEPKPKTTRVTKSAPTHVEVSRRAYEIYLDRSRHGAPGDSHSDWLRAEAELTAKPKRAPRKSKVVPIAA